MFQSNGRVFMKMHVCVESVLQTGFRPMLPSLDLSAVQPLPGRSSPYLQF